MDSDPHGGGWWRRGFLRLFKFPARDPFMSARGILFRKPVGQRILGVWDFHATTASIGDGIAFQAMLNVLRVERGAAKIDLCYIDDKDHPYAARPIFHKNHAWKKNIMMTSCVNPRLGSLFVFDSNDQFARFYLKHKTHYHVHPNPFVPFANPSNWRILTDFRDKNGSLPALSCRPEALNWALRYVEEHVAPAKTIIVHLRNNPRYPDKNFSLDVWREFFRTHAERRDVKFIVIGMKEEIVPEFRRIPNVIHSKDANTTLEQDLALIQVSHAGIYHASGMMAYTWFCGVPSITVGVNPGHVHLGHALSVGGRYNFMNRHQSMIWRHPDAGELSAMFAQLLDDLQTAGWANPARIISVENEGMF